MTFAIKEGGGVSCAIKVFQIFCLKSSKITPWLPKRDIHDWE